MKDNLDNVVMFLIDQASKTAKRYSQREFDQKGLGITVDQWVLLKIIDQYNGLSQRDLSQKSVRDAASITRTLDLLEKKGLVTRLAIEGNRRQYQIKMTAEGNSFIEKNMAMITQHRKKSLDGFSEDEILTLQSMLRRIKENLE